MFEYKSFTSFPLIYLNLVFTFSIIALEILFSNEKFSFQISWKTEMLVGFYIIITNAWIITYSKCSNLHQMLKLLSNFGCLFTFFQLIVLILSDHINSTKSIHIFLNKSHFNLFDSK